MFKSSFLTVIVKSMSTLAGFFFVLMVTRMLDSEQAAQFFLLHSFVLVFASISLMGFDSYLIANLPTFFEQGDLSRAYRLRNLAVKNTVLAGVFLTSGLILGALFVTDNESRFTSVVTLVCVIPIGAVIVLSEALRGFGRFLLPTLAVGVAVPLVTLLLSSILSQWLTYQFDVVAVSFFLSCIVVLVYVSYVSVRFSRVYRSIDLVRVEVQPDYKRLVNFFLVNGLQQTMVFLPVIIIGSVGSSDDLLYYYAALRISLVVSFVLISVNLLIAPMLSKAFNSNDLYRLKTLCCYTATVGAYSSFGIGILIIFFGEFVLQFFSQAHVAAYPHLLVLTLAQIVGASLGAVVMVLLMSGNEIIVRNINLSALACLLIVTPISVTYWGAWGAVLGNILIVLLINITAWFYVYKKLGFFIRPMYRLNHFRDFIAFLRA